MPVTRRKWKTSKGEPRETWGFSFYDPLTKKQVKKSGFAKKSIAEEEMRKEKNRCASGENRNVDKKMTFKELSQQYLDCHCEIYCKLSTKKGYESYLNSINDFMGNCKASEVDYQLVIRFVDKLRKEKKSNKTINNNIVLLKSIFNYAKNNDILVKNPIEKVKKLQNKQIEMNFLKLDDIKLLLEKCKTEKKYTRYYPLLYTAIFTGMRRGEILALTWHDVDFKHKTIRVNKSVYKNTVVDPKTLASNRKVDMTNELCQVLQEHKKNRNKVTTLVFPNKEGKFMDPDNLVERFFKKLTGDCGLYSIRWHDLRHTYVSLLIAAGVPIKYIQSQVGHSSIQVTMDRYGHLLPDVNTQAVSALESLFAKKQEQIENMTA